MKNEFFDKIFDQVIDEASTIYLEDENKNIENIQDEDIVFSDTHNQKMKELFKELKRNENRKNAASICKKVAVVFVVALTITGILITTVEAWRKEVVKFIMKNNDDNYMSISFGEKAPSGENYENVEDFEEVDDKETNTYITDEIKFMYLPEGFEIELNKNLKSVNKYIFLNGDNYVCLTKEVLHNISKESDIENTYIEKIDFKDKEVFKTIKNGNRINYVWYDESNVYVVLSNLVEEETLKFIENIKILKNF